MPDKTRLEHEIEHHETYRTPIGIRILIVLLLVTTLVAGVYIFKLRQNISKKEQEITLMKEDLQKEKTELLKKIKQFENKSSTFLRRILEGAG